MTPEQLATIYREQYGALVHGLRVATRDRPWAEVEDAAQFAFLKLLETPESLRDPLNWLFIAGHRYTLRGRRFHLRHPEYLASDKTAMEQAREPAPDVLEQLVQEERLVWLRQAIAQLTPRQRQAVYQLMAGRRAYGSGKISRADGAAREKAMRNLRRMAAASAHAA